MQNVMVEKTMSASMNIVNRIAHGDDPGSSRNFQVFSRKLSFT